MTQGVQSIKSVLNDQLGLQPVRGALGIEAVQTLQNPFGINAVSVLKTALGISGLQSLKNEFSVALSRIQAMLQTLSGDGIAGLQKTLLEISETDTVHGLQGLSLSLNDLTALYPTASWEIYLDGRPLKTRISSAAIIYDEDSVHNSIEIRSINGDLYNMADPDNGKGTMRIEAQVGGRVIYFLLEERSGMEEGENIFTLWGRGLSAVEDSPYADDIDFLLETPTLASEVAESFVTAVIDWECDNWVVPADFEFNGPPIQGVVRLARIIGAVVRGQDDGSILVRKKFPVRPVHMDGSDFVVDYDRDLVLRALSYKQKKGSGYNAVEVFGTTADIDLPDIDVEEDGPVIGEDVHIRLFWAGRKPSEPIETYVTDGILTDLGEHTEVIEAEVVFEAGIGLTDLPVTAFIDIAWYGDPGGAVSVKKYSKELEINDQAYRVGRVRYTTTFQRYRLSEHDVMVILALFIIPTAADVSVLVKIREGDKPAPALSNPLLSDVSIAVTAGTAWLDDSRYDRTNVSFKAPYDDEATDGVLVQVNDADLGLSGNCHIRRAMIRMNGPSLINELEVIKCRVS